MPKAAPQGCRSGRDGAIGRGAANEFAGRDRPGYVHRQHAELLQKAVAGQLRATHTTLLSPFDPIVWDRARASTLWGFDNYIECNTPEEKRTYGYFVLPILHCGALVGRLDAKAHRAQRVFEVKSLFVEGCVRLSDAAVRAVAEAIQHCADWHGTPEVRLERTVPQAARGFARDAFK